MSPEDPGGPSVAAGPPPAPAVVEELFGRRAGLVHDYVRLLAEEAVLRGLLGPREVPRLWERHILNCAVVTDVIPPDVDVADVGSGAGLPGLVVAIRRPDLRLTLIEPLRRRALWLERAVEVLGVGVQVTVLRSRAEEAPRRAHDVVVSRAVASLDVLLGWSLPLLRPSGLMVAMKGRSAREEVSTSGRALRRSGAVDWGVRRLGEGVLEIPTTVVWVRAGSVGPARSRAARSGRRHGPAT